MRVITALKKIKRNREWPKGGMTPGSLVKEEFLEDVTSKQRLKWQGPRKREFQLRLSQAWGMVIALRTREFWRLDSKEIQELKSFVSLFLCSCVCEKYIYVYIFSLCLLHHWVEGIWGGWEPPSFGRWKRKSQQKMRCKRQLGRGSVTVHVEDSWHLAGSYICVWGKHFIGSLKLKP